MQFRVGPNEVSKEAARQCVLRHVDFSVVRVWNGPQGPGLVIETKDGRVAAIQMSNDVFDDEVPWQEMHVAPAVSKAIDELSVLQ